MVETQIFIRIVFGKVSCVPAFVPNTKSSNLLIMKLLRIIRAIFTSFGLCALAPHQSTKIKWEFCQIVLFTCLCFLVFLLEVSSVLYFWNHLKMGDIKNSLFAALQFTAVISLIGSLLLIRYWRRNVRSVIDGFQNAYDQCEWQMQNKLNENIETGQLSRWQHAGCKILLASKCIERSIRKICISHGERKFRGGHILVRVNRCNLLLRTRWIRASE